MIHKCSSQVMVMVVSSLIMVTSAAPQYPPSAYGAPPQAYAGGYPASGLSSSYGIPSSPPHGPLGNGLPQGPPELPPSAAPTEDPRPLIIKKHVFVHVAPDDKNSGIARRILAPIPRERQVNILFVKAPAPAAPDQQIVELPNDGGKKTLIYVLLKKNDAAPDPDFQLPEPTKPSKPEIYFIRYKDGKKPTSATSTTPAAPAYGVPTGGVPQETPSAPIPVANYASPEGGYPTGPAEQPATAGGYQKK